jgi:hypothetical protein
MALRARTQLFFFQDWGMDDPPYILLARQAEIWLNGEAEKKATI